MLTPQFLLPMHTELVVDLFAGGGGASTGIEQAIGRAVDVASQGTKPFINFVQGVRGQPTPAAVKPRNQQELFA
jgi:hypothetical protein